MRCPSNLARAFSSAVRSFFFIKSLKTVSKRLFSFSLSITVGADSAKSLPYRFTSNLALRDLTVFFPVVSIIFRVCQNLLNIHLLQVIADERNQSVSISCYVKDYAISVNVSASKGLFHIVKFTPSRLESCLIPDVQRQP